MPPFQVVVACLANQCRSPMAEYLLARKIQESRAHGQVEVTSAGIEATPGLPATSGARRAVKRRFGRDELRQHKASLLKPDLLGESDLVLVMTRDQKEHLLKGWEDLIPDLPARLFTLGEYAGRPKADVDDPVGMPDARYDACLELIDGLTTAVAKRLVHQIVPVEDLTPRPSPPLAPPRRPKGRAPRASRPRARRRAP